jgi:hypothetical protein
MNLACSLASSRHHSPVPEKLQPDHDSYHARGERSVDSPTEPEEFLASLQGNEREQQYRRFARKHEELLATICLDSGQPIAAVRMQQTGDSQDSQDASSSSKGHTAGPPVSAKQRSYNTQHNAKNENKTHQPPRLLHSVIAR